MLCKVDYLHSGCCIQMSKFLFGRIGWGNGVDGLKIGVGRNCWKVFGIRQCGWTPSSSSSPCNVHCGKPDFNMFAPRIVPLHFQWFNIAIYTQLRGRIQAFSHPRTLRRYLWGAWKVDWAELSAINVLLTINTQANQLTASSRLDGPIKKNYRPHQVII